MKRKLCSLLYILMSGSAAEFTEQFQHHRIMVFKFLTLGDHCDVVQWLARITQPQIPSSITCPTLSYLINENKQK